MGVHAGRDRDDPRRGDEQAARQEGAGKLNNILQQNSARTLGTLKAIRFTYKQAKLLFVLFFIVGVYSFSSLSSTFLKNDTNAGFHSIQHNIHMYMHIRIFHATLFRKTWDTPRASCSSTCVFGDSLVSLIHDRSTPVLLLVVIEDSRHIDSTFF